MAMDAIIAIIATIAFDHFRDAPTPIKRLCSNFKIDYLEPHLKKLLDDCYHVEDGAYEVIRPANDIMTSESVCSNESRVVQGSFMFQLSPRPPPRHGKHYAKLLLNLIASVVNIFQDDFLCSPNALRRSCTLFKTLLAA
ncbi:hypothetical protein M422DRAFT_267202 [Sphaerobolus stellatus SS14]|uniref:Uncharacterized protein n=1 Tax=Sphaerobolus stellatus (strain SS14) TaxID=990650 RepID=A0A0C9V0H8_SPHS4|nr:hypothetical protein M422DRAFT_267202 [Sphaerobolus stellatus SS14]